MRSLPLVAFALVAACASRRPGGGDVEEQLDAGEPIAQDVAPRDTRVPTTTPYTRSDFTVELPYQAAEQTLSVTVTARAGRVDVHILIDTTGSYGGEIDELQESLLRTVIPGLRTRIPSLTMGVSRFADMPFAPFGATTDHPFQLLMAQTSDFNRVNAAVARLDQPLGNGGDIPESWGEALFQIATGAGLRGPAQELVPAFRPMSLPNSGTIGGVGFRPDATRVVVLASDAPTHEPVDYARVVPMAHGTADAVSALQRIGAHVVGIASDAAARSSLEAVAIATGAAVTARGNCATGIEGGGHAPVSGMCPLVYDISGDGSGLSRTMVDAIARLLDSAVYMEVHGTATDDGQGFITAIEADRATVPAGSASPGREDRLPAGGTDGTLDTFTDVRANSELTFRLHLRNTRVPSGDFPQVHFLRLVFAGDGLVLRETTVRVIVPEGPKLDGGDGEASVDAVDVAPDLPAADDAVTPADDARDDPDAASSD